jgi:hypothetical protein
MPSSTLLRIPPLVTVVLLFALAACAGDAPGDAVPADAPAAATDEVTAAAADVPDACTFFTRAELEEQLGWELRDGELEEQPGGTECEFEVPPGMYVTRTFENPPLPQSVGFSGITVNTHSSTAANFNEFRQQLGAAAEEVPGIGDGAYFYGPDMLYVRVGNRGFSLRIYADAASDADRAKVREVLLALARLGAARLA